MSTSRPKFPEHKLPLGFGKKKTPPPDNVRAVLRQQGVGQYSFVAEDIPAQVLT